ncbi:MAG: hypothetical protein V1800_11245, partial [Candidatus Latescibacterota bacterium]
MNRAIRRFGILMAVVAMIFLSTVPAQCEISPMSIEELTEGASHIVLGQVLRVESRLIEEGTTVVTSATIKPDQVLKGVLPDTVATVEVPGGTIGDLHTWVADQPVYVSGEAVLAFLQRSEDGKLGTYGLVNGRISLEQLGAENIVAEVRQILHNGNYFPAEIRSRWLFGPGTLENGYAIAPEGMTDQTDDFDGGEFLSYAGNTRHFSRRGDGSIQEIDYSGPITMRRFWYSFGDSVGSSRTLDSEGFSNNDKMNGVKMTLVSISDTVTTPFGSFENCVHFRFSVWSSDAGLNDEWFAPNIGCVKRVTRSKAGSVTYLLEHAQITALPTVRVLDGFVFQETERGGQSPVEGVLIMGLFGPCVDCLCPDIRDSESDSTGHFSFGDMAPFTYGALDFLRGQPPYWNDSISMDVEILSESERVVVILPRLTDVEVEDRSGTPLPQRGTLSQNTPNPFNPSTTIRFSVPDVHQGAHVELAIYDLLGQKVRTLVASPVETSG